MKLNIPITSAVILCALSTGANAVILTVSTGYDWAVKAGTDITVSGSFTCDSSCALNQLYTGGQFDIVTISMPATATFTNVWENSALDAGVTFEVFEGEIYMPSLYGDFTGGPLFNGILLYGLGEIFWLDRSGGRLEFHITSVEISETPSAVPVPAALWLFGSGLLGLIGVARRKKS